MREIDKKDELAFQSAYEDCKLVADSIVDDKTFQNADTGLLLFYMEEILDALGKQVAKKPDLEGDGYDPEGNLVYDTWICPNCEKHYEVDYDNYDHCPNCGQKINWNNDFESDSERRIIEKKILPEYFEAVIKDEKKFEIRLDEDDVKAGDTLILKEWDGEKFTGRETERSITYVLRNVPEYGLKDGYCIMCW